MPDCWTLGINVKKMAALLSMGLFLRVPPFGVKGWL